MPGNKFRIVMPARIARVKNQELLIQAAAILNDPSITYTFVGKQEDKGYLDELKACVANTGLKNQICFKQFTTNIENIYAAADLIVLPSRMEGFTNVLMESYLYGRICIVSDIVMNRDVANTTQRYCSVDDAQGLADLIIGVKNCDTDLLQKEVSDNHKYVCENFSMEKMSSRYIEIFRSI